MRVGDQIESAIWMTGDEPEWMRARYEVEVCDAMDELCEYKGFERGLAKFKELRPEHNDAPEVPDHISGQRVRLLVAEALITAKKVQESPDSFIANLDPGDLKRLRKITRAAFVTQCKTNMSNNQCDAIIEEIGPEAALNTLRKTH